MWITKKKQSKTNEIYKLSMEQNLKNQDKKANSNVSKIMDLFLNNYFFSLFIYLFWMERLA